MEQEKLSQRTVNRRRPFQPTDFSQRYLRLRQDANLNESLSDSDDLSNIENTIWRCSCCDPVAEPYYEYKLTKLMSQVIAPMNPIAGLNKMALSRPVSDAFGWRYYSENATGLSLEIRLAEHVKSLLGDWKSVDALRGRIIEASGSPQNWDVLKRVAESHQIPNVVSLIGFFAPFWVRPPITWDANSEISLLDHIFVLYDAPDFLFAEWRNQAQSETVDLKWLCWFILLAQGGSLKRAASLFNWNIHDGFQHHLWSVPYHLSSAEACMFAEVRRLGGDEGDFRRICSDESFVVDPTVGANHKSCSSFYNERSAIDIHFWQETVRWLIANREELEDESCFEVLSWAMHEHTERQRQPPITPFSWKGRSVNAAIERSLEYRRGLERRLNSYSWAGHNWNWTFEDWRNGIWSFIELTSSNELFEEGQIMKHCVSHYDGQCVAGKAAIVSVRHNGKRCLTIEISPETKEVLQVKGAFNRNPFQEEQRMVNLWLTSIVNQKAGNQVNQDQR